MFVLKKIVFFTVTVFLSGAVACSQAGTRSAKAELHDAKGQMIGTVTLTQEQDGVRVTAETSNLSPGFHGFHIHGIGKCEPPFASAGGHFNPAGENHPHHAGDLPNLLVIADGRAFMVVKTDRFKLGDLFNEDGSAIIIHAGPDNHANIPSRYSPDPDAATLSTGDAGGRDACGVITR